MRKVALFAACLTIAMVLGACGGTSESTEPEETNTQTTVSGETVLETTEETPGQEQTAREFSSMEISLETGTMIIQSGDAFSLTYDGGKTATYSITDGTLYIPVQDAGELTLTLPDEYVFDTVSISVEQGNVYGSQSLSTAWLGLELEQGEVTFEGLSITKGCAIQVEEGSAFLEGTLLGVIGVQCREGHIQMEISGRQTDFNYGLVLSDGSMQIGEDSYDGTQQQEIDNGVENAMALTCTQGDISVEFAG